MSNKRTKYRNSNATNETKAKETKENTRKRRVHQRWADRLNGLQTQLICTQHEAAKDREKVNDKLKEQEETIEKLWKVIEDLKTERNEWKRIAQDPIMFPLFSKESFDDFKFNSKISLQKTEKD